MTGTVLEVKGLKVHYATPTGWVLAVDDVTFDLRERETLGIVGESGSGKTTAVSGILRLVAPPGRIAAGQVLLNGTDLIALPEEEMRKFRWSRLSLIPQGAMNSLNPTMKVHAQIADVIETHEGRQRRAELRERIAGLLRNVGLPARVYGKYPHELSGGMKQRVCIAMAVALNPTVVIADEATSALDVVVQRVVAQTMARVRDQLGTSMIMIGHDMGLMAQMVDRIAVMYSGKIVETASVNEIFSRPSHPYSRILVGSVLSLSGKSALRTAGGITHDPRTPPKGCIFRLRCPYANKGCMAPQPMREVRPGVLAACHRTEELEAELA